MSDFGRQTLIAVYGAEPAKLVLIEHGTPDRPFTTSPPLRAALGIVDRPVLSTFGLLGPGKGLEAAIRALTIVAAQYPGRSEERRVGKECVRTCRSRWSPHH